MRRLLLLTSAVLALVGAPQAFAKTVSVDITKTGFSPAKVTLAAGDTVTWKNLDTTQRQIVSDAGTFQSPVLKPGQTYSRTFRLGGTHTYHGQFHPSQKGEIVVNSVSVTLSKRVAIAGASIELSGAVSNGKAGETVRITASPYGGKARQILITTDANGEWSLDVHPLIRTIYKATWNGAESRQTIAFVRPRIGFRKVGRHIFGINVLAAGSLAGRYVTVGRWSGRLHRFVLIRRVYLSRSSHTDNLSFAQVRIRARRGTKLRVNMSRSQAGAGYLNGQSNFIVV